MKGDLIYESSSELDGQARHLERLFEDGRDFRRNRNGCHRNFLCLTDGARLVAGYEGLCEKAVQEVNRQHIGQSGEEVVETRPFSFFASNKH